MGPSGRAGFWTKKGGVVGGQAHFASFFLGGAFASFFAFLFLILFEVLEIQMSFRFLPVAFCSCLLLLFFCVFTVFH